MVTRKHPDQPLSITPGWGGWVEARWRAGKPDEIVAYVRFALEGLRMCLVQLDIREPYTRLHRDLPLGRIENAVNADANVRAELGLGLDQDPGRDLPTFFGMKRNIRGASRYRLERPETRRLGDDFYKAVARAYADAVAAGMNPRKTLADDSDTHADTVARWIREARRRRFLSPGEPGKATGVVRTDDDGE